MCPAHHAFCWPLWNSTSVWQTIEYVKHHMQVSDTLPLGQDLYLVQSFKMAHNFLLHSPLHLQALKERVSSAQLHSKSGSRNKSTKATSRFWSLIKNLPVLYYQTVSFSPTREIIISFSINFVCNKRKKNGHTVDLKDESLLFTPVSWLCTIISPLWKGFTLPQKKG